MAIILGRANLYPRAQNFLICTNTKCATRPVRSRTRDVACAGSAPAAEKTAGEGSNLTPESEAPSEKSSTPQESIDSSDATQNAPNEMNFPTSLLICGAVLLLGVGVWRFVLFALSILSPSCSFISCDD